MRTLSFSQRVGTPGPPVDRVVLVLEQIRRRRLCEAIFVRALGTGHRRRLARICVLDQWAMVGLAAVPAGQESGHCLGMADRSRRRMRRVMGGRSAFLEVSRQPPHHVAIRQSTGDSLCNRWVRLRRFSECANWPVCAGLDPCPVSALPCARCLIQRVRLFLRCRPGGRRRRSQLCA